MSVPMVAKLTATLSQRICEDTCCASYTQPLWPALSERVNGTNGAPGARGNFDLLETRDHLQQGWGERSSLYGDGATIIPEVSLVMSAAECLTC